MINLENINHWQELINTVVQGDCLEGMKLIPDNSVDLVVTSPPYNKNGFRGKRDTSKGKGRWSGADIMYGDYGDDLSEDEYKDWQIKILNECFRVIKPTGSIFYNHKIRRANHKASHPFEWIGKSRCTFYQQIIWNRLSSCDGNIGYLTPITELLFWLTKEKPSVYQKIKGFDCEIWNFPPETNTKHPAPFPIKLTDICLQMTTKEDDIVLDPFMGSWTTARACKDLGRNFIGFELSEEYCKIGEKRLEQLNLF